MGMDNQFIVTIGFRAKPGKAADLERALRQRVPISRTEATTLDYRPSTLAWLDQLISHVGALHAAGLCYPEIRPSCVPAHQT